MARGWNRSRLCQIRGIIQHFFISLINTLKERCWICFKIIHRRKRWHGVNRFNWQPTRLCAAHGHRLWRCCISWNKVIMDCTGSPGGIWNLKTHTLVHFHVQGPLPVKTNYSVIFKTKIRRTRFQPNQWCYWISRFQTYTRFNNQSQILSYELLPRSSHFMSFLVSDQTFVNSN